MPSRFVRLSSTQSSCLVALIYTSSRQPLITSRITWSTSAGVPASLVHARSLPPPDRVFPVQKWSGIERHAVRRSFSTPERRGERNSGRRSTATWWMGGVRRSANDQWRFGDGATARSRPDRHDAAPRSASL